MALKNCAEHYGSLPRFSKAETLMVCEVAEENAVHWMSPLDANEEMVLDIATNGRPAHEGRTQVAFADDSVRFISEITSLETLRALVTVAGRNRVVEY